MATAIAYENGIIEYGPKKGSAYWFEEQMIDNVLEGKDTSLLSYALVARALNVKITIKFTPLFAKLYLAV